MGEAADRIATDIGAARRDLRANLDDLEQKVKSATDWRGRYRTSPGTFIAVAVAGGVLVALLTRGRRSSFVPAVAAPVAAGVAKAARVRMPRELDESINEIKGALIGVVASKAKSYLSKLVPGFEHQLAGKSNIPGRNS